MDTREKIITADGIAAATAEGNWIIFAGLFDPMTADNASVLAHLAQSEPHCRLGVFVLDSHDTHLPSKDRAVLVASLRCVDLVVLGTACCLPQESARIRMVSDPAAEQQHSEAFVRLVLRRQKGGS